MRGGGRLSPGLLSGRYLSRQISANLQNCQVSQQIYFIQCLQKCFAWIICSQGKDQLLSKLRVVLKFKKKMGDIALQLPDTGTKHIKTLLKHTHQILKFNLSYNLQHTSFIIIILNCPFHHNVSGYNPFI